MPVALDSAWVHIRKSGNCWLVTVTFNNGTTDETEKAMTLTKRGARFKGKRMAKKMVRRAYAYQEENESFLVSVSLK